MDVRVERKSSFAGENPCVYDDRGIFYSRDGPSTFNLPVGDYQIFNAAHVGKPINFSCPTLPWPDKLGFLPRNDQMRIIIADNVNGKPIGRAAIDTFSDRIYVNPDFIREATTPEYLCAIAHEMGHYFYDNEEYCDRYAMRQLIKYGLNPSQFVSFTNLLSDYSNERKQAAIEYAEKIHARTGFRLARLWSV